MRKIKTQFLIIKGHFGGSFLLAPLFLLTSCLQTGLESGGAAITQDTSSSSSSADPIPKASTKVANIPYSIDEADGGNYLLTSYAAINRRGGGTYVLGPDANPSNIYGEDYCFSNERRAAVSSPLDPDSYVACKRPTSIPSSDLGTLANMSSKKIPALIHAIKMKFLTHTDSAISLPGAIVQTAPISQDADGYLTWDEDNIKTISYGSTDSCSLANENSVGFAIPEALENRNRYFLSGLWIFARSNSKVLDDTSMTVNHTEYDVNLSIGGSTSSALVRLFTDPITIISSFVVGALDDSDNPVFRNVVKNGADYELSDTPSPQSTTFGRIKSSVPSGVTEYETVDMGKTSGSGTVDGWDSSVIVGLCIHGTRTLLSNNKNTEGAYIPRTDPLIHALKAELRSIRVRKR